MYEKIMIPVDLAHVERLGKAIDTATELAKSAGASLLFVGVTAETPTEVARNPAEHAKILADFGAQQGRSHDVEVETRSYASHDPTSDLDKTLIAAAGDNGVDLIVMASHVPGVPEHFFSSHAGAVAMHSEASVFVVR